MKEKKRKRKLLGGKSQIFMLLNLLKTSHTPHVSGLGE